MKKSNVALMALSLVLVLSLLSGCGKITLKKQSDKTENKNSQNTQLTKAEQAYVDAVDVDYAYKSTMMLNDIVNSDLGGRNSGSDAEHEAADLLKAEMDSLGLANVHKDPFTVAKWQFNGATIEVDGEDTPINAYSYASGATEEDGIEAEIIYVGKGTRQDYDKMDAKGKIVLIDLNQREDWWVTYPTLEAELNGAVAIVNSNVGGYGEISDKAYNSQDFCGPVTIPSINITQKDAEALKSKIEEGKTKVTLKVDNVVEEGGTSYNIWGEIPGKDPTQEAILIGDHYDVHFTGFQDDNAAVGTTLAIAKAMKDSNYQPERTIRFILHGAEEYGAIGTRYDWSVGAWEQINKNQPGWSGTTLSYINFELPAYEFSDTYYVAATPANYSFIEKFIKRSPKPEGVFEKGIYSKPILETVWADNFSYSIAGVPTVHNGFINDEKGDVFDFYKEIYHSNYDTKKTYNKKVLDFNLKFYGTLAIAMDNTLFLELDMTQFTKGFKDSMTDSVGKANQELLLEKNAEFETNAATYYGELVKKNEEYKALLKNPEVNKAQIDVLKAEALVKNKKTLDLYKTWQDQMLRLSWEDAGILPHEEVAKNIELLSNMKKEISQDNGVQKVLDDYFWQLDGGRAWYSMYFSSDVTDYFKDYVINPENYDNNRWGQGRVTGYLSAVEKLEPLLSKKYDQKNPSVSNEVKIMDKAIETEQKRLDELVKKEVTGFDLLIEKIKVN